MEPNQALVQQLRNLLLTHSTVGKLTVKAETSKEYSWPKKAFGIILFTHSLYHMPGAKQDILAKAAQVLKPGGFIVTALLMEKGGIYQMIGSFWQQINYSRLRRRTVAGCLDKSL